MNNQRQIFFWAFLIAFPVAFAVLVLPLVWQQVRVALQPAVVAYVAANLSESEKQTMRQQLQDSAGGMFMEIPEPLVGRVASPGFSGDFKEAAVVINDAGMRSGKNYTTKSPDVFRIVCLGDSFVFGTGVPEQTRFCNQLETFYQKNGITVNGKRIEALAVGLPSYTAVQGVSYLTARLTPYAPDVVILVSVHNDIMDGVGVTSFGALTTEYSIERRELGSAVFNNQAGLPFGQTYYSALTTDLSPEARQRWDKAFAAIQRLGEVQAQRDGKLLLSVLQMPARHNQYFYEIYKQQAQSIGQPYLMVNYWQGKKTRLPNDGHPNAYGHDLIAAHYIHALAELGWIPVPPTQRPVPESFVADPLNPLPDTNLLLQERTQFINEHLSDRLDFQALSDEAYGALLGGFFPEANGERSAPWASIRAGFLLKQTATQATSLKLVLQLPDRVEMFPLELVISLNGVRVATPSWAYSERGKSVTVTVPVDKQDEIIEVMLETPRYMAYLQDHRMKSYRLLSASLE